MSTLPIIDLTSSGLSQEIDIACRQTGFFYLKNHNISEDLIEQSFKISQEFFSWTKEKKDLVKVTSSYRGYVESGKAKMYNAKYHDTKESFVWGIYEGEVENPPLQQRITGKNNFPEVALQMQTILLAYIKAVEDCGKMLLKAMAKALNLEKDYFTKHFKNSLTRATLLHYPALPYGNDEIFGVSPHTDFGTITILAQDKAGGLQVKNTAGEWIDVPYISDTLVVNVADLLTLWTSGLYISAYHRVVNKAHTRRYSIAAFIDPDFTTPITPINSSTNYKPVTCGEYIISRIDQAFNRK